MPINDLDFIRTKFRRLTRSPSPAQISDNDIDDYVNTFLLYDLPEHLRLFALKRTLTFYTQPNVGTYETNTTDPLDPLYNFKDRYITVHQPIYVAGYQAGFFLSRDSFFGLYPFVNAINQNNLRGDGVTTVFSGTLTAVPVLQNNVLFTSVDAAGNAMQLIDYPFNSQIGALGPVNDPQSIPSPYGQINYITGAFSLNFTTPPGNLAPIYSETVPYQPSLPLSVLFFDNKFTLRPIPDKSYPVQMEVFVRPTALLSSGERPDLAQWCQYIAYGAAKKCFEDRQDMDSVNMIFPEFKEQELLVGRSTIVQQTSQRSPTIYAQNNQWNWNAWNNWNNGTF